MKSVEFFSWIYQANQIIRHNFNAVRFRRFSMSFHFNFQLISAQSTRHCLQTNIILCYSCTSLTQENVFSPWVGKMKLCCIAVEEKTAFYYALYHAIVLINCRDLSILALCTPFDRQQIITFIEIFGNCFSIYCEMIILIYYCIWVYLYVLSIDH